MFHNENLHLVFAVFAFVCFVIAATNLVGEWAKVRVIAIGLAFMTATLIF